MSRVSFGLILAPMLLTAVAASSGSEPHAVVPSNIVSTGPSRFDSGMFTAAIQAKGRYKKQGDDCVWDANDGGPDQCTPQTKGRFKKGGDDSCTWDPNDAGPDQCRPPKGRWKKGGDNSCSWDPKDDGPDQCNPRRPR